MKLTLLKLTATLVLLGRQALDTDSHDGGFGNVGASY